MYGIAEPGCYTKEGQLMTIGRNGPSGTSNQILIFKAAIQVVTYENESFYLLGISAL